MSQIDPIAMSMERMIGQIGEFFWDAFIALRVNNISGDYVEFGSYGGQTLRLAHEAMQKAPGPDRHMWAFDSFGALPDPIDPIDERWSSDGFGGAEGQGGVDRFHEAVAAHGVPRDAYTTVEGYYHDSLPSLGTDGEPVDIALAYVDCNMYRSTVDVLGFLEPRLKHGMIVAFDDYYDYSPDNVSGERAALHEFLAAHPEWHFQLYRHITWAGAAFIVERHDLLGVEVAPN